ncbi:MAG: DUF3392 family protein [Luteolibacter sp.]|jgi:hypothetical protein
MNHILETTASWLRPNLTLIAFTFVCTLLVLYGHKITRFFKHICRAYPLWLRVLVFMVVSGVGYGWATSELTGLLKNHLLEAAGKWLFVWVLLIFIGLGILADRSKQV